MKRSPSPKQNRSKTPSPIKVKDYFTNPLHKIKQPAFTDIGFSVSALNTFVKSFTYRQNSKYISLASIRSFIKSFTKNNPELMQLYEDFFHRNFTKKGDLIQLDHFMEFFIHENNQEEISTKNIKMVYDDMAPINAETLVRKSEQEAEKIISMVNYRYGTPKSKTISQQAFINAMYDQNC